MIPGNNSKEIEPGFWSTYIDSLDFLFSLHALKVELLLHVKHIIFGAVDISRIIIFSPSRGDLPQEKTRRRKRGDYMRTEQKFAGCTCETFPHVIEKAVEMVHTHTHKKNTKATLLTMFVVPGLMRHMILSCSQVALNTKYKHCYNLATRKDDHYRYR